MFKLITKYSCVNGTVLTNKENKRKPKKDGSAPRRASGGRLLHTKHRQLKLCHLFMSLKEYNFPKLGKFDNYCCNTTMQPPLTYFSATQHFPPPSSAVGSIMSNI